MKLLAIFTAAVLASAATAPPVEYSAGVPASCSKLPADLELRNKTYVLPDPFRFLNGKKVKSVEDWHCRAAQIGELFQVSD